MLDLARNNDNGTTIRKDVVAHLYDAFSAEGSALASLDRWTQRRVTDENLAKLALVLEADDPVEHCYQNLVREIDTEAEAGIYLMSRSTRREELRDLIDDPGISGRLHELMPTIAPVIFADELSHSNQGMDLVWVTIDARYDRARIDANVSLLIMSHLVADGDSTADMAFALRSLMYSFHEDLARRLCKLPLILNDRATRELVTMVSELAVRAGDYNDRIEAIEERAAAE